MAFKTAKTYNEEKFGGLFLLRNDGDYADVIFMYRSEDDVLVADTHYVKTADYTGYVHCAGHGCPACGKGIRVQTKLFIPLFNITAGELQFWDRTMRFEPQLNQDVFSRYPNPSEIVFRITRHGQAGSVDTTYEITAVAKNTIGSYEKLLADNNAVMPDYYEHICKEFTPDQLHKMLNSGAPNTGNSSYGDMPNYQVRPRAATAAPAAAAPTIPDAAPVDAVEESAADVPWANDGDSDIDDVTF